MTCEWEDRLMYYKTSCNQRIRVNRMTYERCPKCGEKIVIRSIISKLISKNPERHVT